MFTLAFIVSRYEMRRRLIGARADDPVLPDPDPPRRSARPAFQERARKPVDRGRSPQRRAHVPLVSPQSSGGDEDLL